MTPKPNCGFVEWFHPSRPGELERAQFVTQMMQVAGFTHCRFNLSWAELIKEEAAGKSHSFYDDLIPLLASRFTLLPNLAYTPPSWGITASPASPPRELERYGWAIAQVCERWGEYFPSLEVWNEPNSPSYWRREDDPDLRLFAELARIGADSLAGFGKQSVLGGPSPLDLGWLCFMERYGVLAKYDVLGLHGFPGTWDGLRQGSWQSFSAHLAEVRMFTRADQDVWITEVGASSLRDPALPHRVFAEVMCAPTSHVFWYAAMDFPSDMPTMQRMEAGDISDDDYHMGLLDQGWNPKALYQYLTSKRINKRNGKAAAA